MVQVSFFGMHLDLRLTDSLSDSAALYGLQQGLLADKRGKWGDEEVMSNALRRRVDHR
jgi:hypothetical protein